MSKFSVVFMPNTDSIDLVRQMKIRLSDKIGWFHSKNSMAHFTIFEFLENDTNIQQIGKQLKRIASGIQA